MVTFYLSSAYDEANQTLSRLRRALSDKADFLSKNNLHQCGSANDADLIILVETGYLGPMDVIKCFRSFSPKPIVVFSETDWPFAALPGLYPSLTTKVSHAKSWSYLLEPKPTDLSLPSPEYLYSFLGRKRTYPSLRGEVIKLDTLGTPCVDLEHVHQRYTSFDAGRDYWHELARTHFPLCPRGIGASSIRLFECMRLGRAPVIISDHWVPPEDCRWDDFSLRVREDDVRAIPDLLKERVDEAAEMGQRAKMTYDEHFAPHLLIKKLASLGQMVRFPTASFASRCISQFGCRELKALIPRALRRQLPL